MLKQVQHDMGINHLPLLQIVLNSVSFLPTNRERFMVVCVCNAIREKDVRAAARAGASTPCEAYARVGRRPRCGQCFPFAREIIRNERASA